MTTGDKGKLFILSVPLFTLSLLSKIVCSLWYTPGKQMRFDCLLGDSINRACTNDKSNPKALSTLIRFQTKTELFCSVFKKICVHTYRFRILFARPYYNAVSVRKRCYTLSAHGQMNSTHAHFNISAREIGAKLKPHGSVCPPSWILTVEWSGARSCLF